jgi:diguanylate cyclase (GGDEF)-like protein
MDLFRQTWKSWLVPVLVLGLGLGAGVATTTLYRHADSSRKAQLQISYLRQDLGNLEEGAFKADPRSGGSPASARRLIATSRASIDEHLRRLAGDGRLPSALDGLGSEIARLNPAIGELFAIGASRGGYLGSSKTNGLLQSVSVRRATIMRQLDRATASYDRSASHARSQAMIGSSGTLLILLAAFGFFYRRAARARATAEALAGENERLWKSSHDDAITDALTGLRNRRALNQDFEELSPRTWEGAELLLAMFDLDGFKQYNDTFGHGAGDALLTRVGEQLARAVDGAGTAYRMGGDEFCVVAKTDTAEGAGLVDAAEEALSDEGEGWQVGCSYGVAWVPSDAVDLVGALRVADQRMYARKAGRASAGRQTTAALVQVLAEQGDGLDGHADAVAELAISTAEQLGVVAHEIQQIGLAAQLHDIGKSAIPEAVLNKPTALTADEWRFIRRHTLIGERIILAAPALQHVAKIVRSSHERFDGGGYPDGLTGHEIPIGSRIVAVADAFHAMRSSRPYAPAVGHADAIAELERCAGTQFDPTVVAAFVAVADARQTVAAALAR